MEESIRFGRIGGVAVGAHWSLLVVAALLTWSLATVTLPADAPGAPAVAYWVAGAVAAVAFLGGVLAHELGHAAVARRHGVGVEGITLWVLGGVARLEGQARTPDDELRIALAGPAVSVALAASSAVGAVMAGWLGLPRLVAAVLGWLALVNAVLAGFNLMPAAPLDGGRVLAAVLWRRTGDAVLARQRAARAGRTFGRVLVVLGIVQALLGLAAGLWLALVGWFIVVAARAEEEGEAVREAFAGVTVAEVAGPTTAAPAAWTVAEVVRYLVAGSRAPAYPVVDVAGRPVGMITLAQLREVEPARWTATPVASLAAPPLVVGAGEPVLAVVERMRGRPAVVVDAEGRTVGLLTMADLASAVERLGLQRRLGGHPSPR